MPKETTNETGTTRRLYPFQRYEKDKVYLEVHSSDRVSEKSTTVDTLVAIKVTEKAIEDRNVYSRFYREKTIVPVKERTKAEIFDKSLHMQSKDVQKFYKSRYFLFSRFDRGI